MCEKGKKKVVLTLPSFQDDFVEKNQKFLPNQLRLIIQGSTRLFEKSEVTMKCTTKTTASALKSEIDSLMEKLKQTVIAQIKIRNILM